jgi:peroxiredoxin
VVRDVNGHPVVGAKVMVGSEKNQVYLPPPAPGNRRRTLMPASPVTDANGKYTVGKPDGPYAVFAVSDDGLAQASSKQLESGTDLVLRPWGRIEGTVKLGNQTVPRASVSMWRISEQKDPWEKLMHVEEEVRADANGHFVFPRVPPGEVWLSLRLIPNHADATQWRYVQVESGQTATVPIGGTGDRITGHVVVPTELASVVDWTNKQPTLSSMGWFNRKDVPLENAKHQPNETPEQFTDVELKFGQTEIGKAVKEARITSSFTINADGTFVINDLRPGKYLIGIRNLKETPSGTFMEDVTRGEATVTVPATDPITGPPADSNAAAPTTIDVGAITLKAVEHHAQPGQPAPDFTTTTLDGKAWKLGDQKGKTVVLFFWATYRQNMGEDKFGGFSNKWGSNPNVSILGICMPDDVNDKEGKQIKSIAAKLNFHFPESAEGERLMQAFDSSWPEAILIDKSGIIVEKYLDADSAEKAMEAEMAK